MSKDHKLSEREKERKAIVEELIRKEYASRGFQRQDLTVSLLTANLIALMMLVAAGIVSIGLFRLVNHGFHTHSLSLLNYLLFILSVVILAVAHEWIHGFTWSRFAENGWKNIEFGFIKEALTPYCTCMEPMSRRGYAIGVAMPGIVLGILPMLVGILICRFWVMIVGLVMFSAAGGDLAVLICILRYKVIHKDVLFLDHPTKCGVIALVRPEAGYF